MYNDPLLPNTCIWNPQSGATSMQKEFKFLIVLHTWKPYFEYVQER